MKDSTHKAAGKAGDNSGCSAVPGWGVGTVEHGGTGSGTKAERGSLKALAQRHLKRNADRNTGQESVFHQRNKKTPSVPHVVPLVRCTDCQHFEPDQVNPVQGIGRCRIGADGDPASRGYRQLYPTNPRQCDGFEITPEALLENCREACKRTSLDPKQLAELVADDPGWWNPAAIQRWVRLIEDSGWPGE